MSKSKKHAIKDLNGAIHNLKKARHLVECNRFDKAENQIGESLVFIGKAIRHINRAEQKSH